jgi:peptidoglycan-associated lipoprotein
MVRNKTWISIMVLAMVLGAAGCGGKKGPEGATAGAGTTESPATLPGADTGALPGGSLEAGVTLPTVYFDYNQASVRSDAKAPLKQAAETLKGNSSAQVTIEGHCDERGSSEYNLALGERRAQAVKSYLRTLGIDGKKLSTISYGKERPIDSGHTESAWAKNRRAELIVNR